MKHATRARSQECPLACGLSCGPAQGVYRRCLVLRRFRASQVPLGEGGDRSRARPVRTGARAAAGQCRTRRRRSAASDLSAAFARQSTCLWTKARLYAPTAGGAPCTLFVVESMPLAGRLSCIGASAPQIQERLRSSSIPACTMVDMAGVSRLPPEAP